MRQLLFVLFILITASCLNKKEKDFAELDMLIAKSDSLLVKLQKTQSQTSEYLYFISDDSLKRDSLARVLELPDSIGIYRFFEISQNELSELVFHTKQEVFFAKDQIYSVKTEYLENNISSKEYKNEVTNLKEIMYFLESRVDSNIMNIREKYYFGQTIIDSLD